MTENVLVHFSDSDRLQVNLSILVYFVFTRESHQFKSLIFSIRDYYPLWQISPLSFKPLSTQISTSTPISSPFSIPGEMLSLPTIMHGAILCTLTLESASEMFGDANALMYFVLVFLDVCIEGVCGRRA